MKNNEATDTTQTAAVAEQGAHVAPEKAPSKKRASQKKGAPKGQKTANGRHSAPVISTCQSKDTLQVTP